ncbi:helix-turn-helix domain-containing protein [Spirosoma sp. KCTC 42546]|uniref:helix-turn-helix domain-containing protein n=1 Tax=Spirosoma sp. KCTC 42546 TaxID=2520506 RepID=UPI00115B888D|nr:helix-turn-helix domain-containing protein [Spirosoma sp. KCTC 42546]QDK80876.1 helix-turn-helix domain-containing protein [Spirosoma sp. KCTC 42546]
MKISVESELLATLQATLEATRLELKNQRKAAKGNDPFTLDEAASYLRVARSTLHQYVKKGELTPSEYGSRVWLLRSELDGFLARHRRQVVR